MIPLLKLSIVIGLVAIFASPVTAVVLPDCKRMPYYGSPLNMIHKAQEYLHGVMQYSNVNTTVRMIAYNRTNTTTNTSINEDVIYDISYPVTQDGETTTQRKALIMRIITPQGQFPRLGNYVLADPTHGSFPYYLTVMFNLQLVLDEIYGDPELYLSCSMLKEEYTYFPALFPSRFSKILQ